MIASYECVINNTNSTSKDPKFDLSRTLDGSKKGSESIWKKYAMHDTLLVKELRQQFK
jgi:hypothetical protein